MKPADNHLVVFVKAPRIGRVKTRLAADVGTVAAWAFYRRTMARVVQHLARDRRWHCWLAVSPDGAVHQPRLWPPGVSLVSQGTGDLGDRMGRVMGVLPPGPAVIVGADIPDIAPAHAAAAFRSLGDHDAVFGPAPDGGYWLVGLRRRPHLPDVFRNVRWSSPHALADTRAMVRR